MVAETFPVWKMVYFVLIVCCLGSLVSSDPNVIYNVEDAEAYFEDFIKTYDKNYDNPEEKQSRFEIFMKNLDIVNENNKNSDQAVHGVTQFSDLTAEEFRNMYMGLRPTEDKPCEPVSYSSSSSASDAPVPDSFDWRDKNVVTPVKDQGPCGSCYAFSATGNIEAQYAIKHGKLVELSEQQLMDCDNLALGCEGGWMSNSFIQLQYTDGIMSAADYPYNISNLYCQYNPKKGLVKVSGCRSFTFSAEDELRKALVDTGPLSIAVCGDTFQTYTDGILTDCDACPLFPVDHGVLLVGYGSENGTDYWTIKNSWGETFGEKGYIRIKRNVNACGMLSDGSQVVTAVLE